MPRKITWTEAQDMQIRRLRAEGRTWDEIGTALGVTRWTVIERGRRVGAKPPPPGWVRAPPPPAAGRQPDHLVGHHPGYRPGRHALRADPPSLTHRSRR